MSFFFFKCMKKLFTHPARRAEKIRFHSSQIIGYGRRETLIVKLRCKGARELIHELCHPDWIGQVIVEEPEELKQGYESYLQKLTKAIFK